MHACFHGRIQGALRSAAQSRKYSLKMIVIFPEKSPHIISRALSTVRTFPFAENLVELSSCRLFFPIYNQSKRRYIIVFSDLRIFQPSVILSEDLPDKVESQT